MLMRTGRSTSTIAFCLLFALMGLAQEKPKSGDGNGSAKVQQSGTVQPPAIAELDSLKLGKIYMELRALRDEFILAQKEFELLQARLDKQYREVADQAGKVRAEIFKKAKLTDVDWDIDVDKGVFIKKTSAPHEGRP